MNKAHTRLNVIFLLDNQPPKHILLLRRAAWKKYAANLYTGIGGKMEGDESVLEGAKRELKEETGLDVPIIEFARCIVNNERILYYFWGILDKDNAPECNEGELEWVAIRNLSSRKDIIPNSQMVLQEWQKGDFNPKENFTVSITRPGTWDVYSRPTKIEISLGLLD